MLRDKRLLRRLGIIYYQMMGGPTWVEDHWCFNWFGGRRALWVVRKTHALSFKPSYEVRFTFRGDWTITWLSRD